MKSFIVGDIHGAGEELEKLLDKMSPASTDRIIFVGDVFDRGLHANTVWKIIQKYNVEVLMGNHEHKMLNFLQGKRDWLPQHYYVALNLLMELLTPNELFDWLQKRPLLKDYGSFAVVHAAVDPLTPNREDVSWNVYGNAGKDEKMPQDADTNGERYFWDEYDGDKLVVYGHLVTNDNLPRMRRNKAGKINSIGLDTAAVHGENLTGFCPEDFMFYSYRSGIDWGDKCKKQSKVDPPKLGEGLMKFVQEQRKKFRHG